MKQEKHAGGRPSSYSKELGDTICEEIGNGLSMRSICAKEGMPDMSTVFRWIRTDEEFCKQYARATEERTEAHNETLLDLGDEAKDLAQDVDPKAAGAVVQAIRIKADNLKWVMSKMKPKKYGDKLDVMSDGKAIQSNTIVIKDFNNGASGQ